MRPKRLLTVVLLGWLLCVSGPMLNRHNPAAEVATDYSLIPPFVTAGAPPLVMLVPNPSTRYLGLAAWTVMSLTYLPTLIFYRRSPFWVLTLPLVGALYLGMTWSSALRYWQGERSRWKDRTYLRPVSRHKSRSVAQ